MSVMDTRLPDWTDGGRRVELTMDDGRVVAGQLDIEEVPLPDGYQDMVATVYTDDGEVHNLAAAKSWRFLPEPA